MDRRRDDSAWHRGYQHSWGQHDQRQYDEEMWRAQHQGYDYRQPHSQYYDGYYRQGSSSDAWRERGWPQEQQHEQHSDPYYDHAAQDSYQSYRTARLGVGRYGVSNSEDHHQGGPRTYERRAYRPKVVLSDLYDEALPGSSHSRHYSTHSERKEKKNGHLRAKPRKSYHTRTLEPPLHYPSKAAPPGPLPLLVLDLNGTLVNRKVGTGGSTSERSKQPLLRPYLKSFLQYCLGIQRADLSREDHQDAWDGWESSLMATKDARRGKRWPHGAQFWSSNSEPAVKEHARFRLLLWSSAQPHNVDSMARAILSPEQAEQLLRVYARDTLVTRRLYSQKAPSIKDLEILWAVLNNKSIGPEGEARLLAEARDREDEASPDEEGSQDAGRGASRGAANRAQESVVMPKRDEGGHYRDGAGYGQHNTLLLDDSVDKAKLQPFNHILLPEFGQARAQKTLRAMRRQGKRSISKERGSASGEESEAVASEADGKEDEVDDVLLQVVGVLEHARYQVNVSSWIRFGGLGDFGGMQHEHPYYLESDEDGVQVDEKLIEEACAYFSQPASPSDHDDDGPAGPRLNASIDARTQAFWAQEGLGALEQHGIPIQKF